MKPDYIYACSPEYLPRAAALAEKLGTGLTDVLPEAGYTFLSVGPGGLSLVRDGLELRGDLDTDLRRLRPENLNGELLVKASGIKKLGDAPLAVDATAGLGEDSLLLAAAGFRVIMFEYDPVIAALLEDSMSRVCPELEPVVSRMTLICGDSIKGMGELGQRPDAVLLDPMFPERHKSASVKKKFQLLHLLESPCCDEEELLAAAIAANPRRVIIKRPAKGPFLAGRRPGFSLKGKAIRYDIIPVRTDNT